MYLNSRSHLDRDVAEQIRKDAEYVEPKSLVARLRASRERAIEYAARLDALRKAPVPPTQKITDLERLLHFTQDDIEELKGALSAPEALKIAAE